MLEMFCNEFLELFNVVDMINQGLNQGVVDNDHVPLKNVNVVEVNSSCLVKICRKREFHSFGTIHTCTSPE